LNTSVFTYFRYNIELFFEQFSERCFIYKRTSQDTEDIEHTPVEMKVMLYNSNKAVSGYGTINLYPNCVFRLTPERFNVQMLLNPFEKQLHLPTLLIKHSNIFCADIKRIGNICKRAFEFLGIVHNFAKSTRIFLFELISGKFNSLVTYNPIITLDKVFSFNDFILKLAFLRNWVLNCEKMVLFYLLITLLL